MTKITEEQLIESLKSLKDIKPRKEWAVLLKSQILSEAKKTKVIKNPARFADFRSIFLQPKLAYSFAVLLLLIFGVFGFMKFSPYGNLSQQSPASVAQQTGLKQNVVALNSKIDNLVQITKEGKTDTIPSAKNDVKTTITALAKDLKDNPTQDPATLKDIATSLKTLSDVTGIDLSANPDVQDLYQTVVKNQIADLQKTTLTDDQKKTLAEAQDLYGKGDYNGALEKIWDLTNSTVNNQANSPSLINTTSPTNK